MGLMFINDFVVQQIDLKIEDNHSPENTITYLHDSQQKDEHARIMEKTLKVV